MIGCGIVIIQTRDELLVLFCNMKHDGKADGIPWLDMTPLMALHIKIFCVRALTLPKSN